MTGEMTKLQEEKEKRAKEYRGGVEELGLIIVAGRTPADDRNE